MLSSGQFEGIASWGKRGLPNGNLKTAFLSKLIYINGELLMQCPVCKNTSLAISERQGIEIDYCPACRGVWLDRGELDKLIDRATALAPPPQAAPPYRGESRSFPDPRYGYHKKPKSWLNEIFD